MSDIYGNFVISNFDMHRVPNVSPLTPGEQENMFTYNQDFRTMSVAGLYSPSSMESSQTEDSMGTQQIFNIISNPMESNHQIGACEIKIPIQPVDKFRFRYKSEMMGTHGSLLGERDGTSHKKEVPTAQLVNCPFEKAVIRCTLVTADEERRFPHAHHLVRKDGAGDKDDPHDIEVSKENNYTAMFCNMGIIHTAKKHIKEEILRKRRIEVLEEKKRRDYNNVTITTREDIEMKMEAEKAQKWMNLNSVALCFQGFFYGDNNVLIPITDKIYSRPINNLKSALTGELKICRIDKHTSSCEGNEEIWLLVEKVGKKNIKVKLYEIDDRDNLLWDADGRFSEHDVHHQYAIVFKTPPYKDINITEPKEVFLRLERPSDGEYSNSIRFVYKPSNKVLNRKRPRMSSSSGSMEFAQKASAPNPQVENCIPMTETCINFGSDISNISGELKKLMDEDNHCDIKEMKAFFNESMLENYLSLMSPVPSPTGNLVTDGGEGSELENSEEEFSNDTLRKVMAVFKEVESKNISKQAAIIKVRDLLQEFTNYGDTPLHNALRHEQYGTAKYLIMIMSTDPSFKNIINLQNSCGKTPLHLAVLQNQPDIVRALLKVGADPNLYDEEDANSLHNAVLISAYNCLDELLNSSIKLNLEAHTESGWSALHLAAKVGSLYSVQALVEAGVNVNSTDMSYGRTALHIAVDSNHKHIVNYLLTKTKIDVNMKNFGGNTALHNAVVKGGKCAEELVKILKMHGADPEIRNNNIQEEEEDDDENSDPPSLQPLGEDSTLTIKKEASDTEDETVKTGESSFDLARNDPKLMQLLRDEVPVGAVQVEEFNLKEESEDEMMLQERVITPSRSVGQNRSNVQQRPLAPMTTIPASQFNEHEKLKQEQPQQQKQVKQQKQQQQQKPSSKQADELLSDEHTNRIKHILDRTGGWERLAQHMNLGSLVRLYKKTTSPSSALFGKIKLQYPNITVGQVKQHLKEIEAFEALQALEKR